MVGLRQARRRRAAELQFGQDHDPHDGLPMSQDPILGACGGSVNNLLFAPVTPITKPAAILMLGVTLRTAGLKKIAYP